MIVWQAIETMPINQWCFVRGGIPEDWPDFERCPEAGPGIPPLHVGFRLDPNSEYVVIGFYDGFCECEYSIPTEWAPLP